MLGRRYLEVGAMVVRLCLAVLLAATAGCTGLDETPDSAPAAEALCSDAWYAAVEEQVPTGDGHGHGPDIGSDEWKSVVEFKLGVRGQPDVPERASEPWCVYIDRLMAGRYASG